MRRTSFSLLFLLLVGCITFVSSCKKDQENTDPGTGYYMRFKVNGTLVEYKAQVEGVFDQATSLQHNTSLAGLKESFVSTKNNMTVLLATEDETQTGKDYSSFTPTASGMEKAKLASLVYFDENGKEFFSWMEELAPALPPGTETKAVIRITEATDKYFKGSFSGVLYTEDYADKITVTDGDFYARRGN